MTRVPMIATIEPIISYVSGFFLSTILPPNDCRYYEYAAICCIYSTKFGGL
jgi:hypothetical protein